MTYCVVFDNIHVHVHVHVYKLAACINYYLFINRSQSPPPSHSPPPPLSPATTPPPSPPPPPPSLPTSSRTRSSSINNPKPSPPPPPVSNAPPVREVTGLSANKTSSTGYTSSPPTHTNELTTGFHVADIKVNTCTCTV